MTVWSWSVPTDPMYGVCWGVTVSDLADAIPEGNRVDTSGEGEYVE